MTDSIDTARARAEAIYRAVKPVPPMEKQSATAEYKAAQGAVRLRMAQQRAASLAKEAGTLTDPAVKLKAKGKKRKQGNGRTRYRVSRRQSHFAQGRIQ